jgi:hypothetical protein
LNHRTSFFNSPSPSLFSPTPQSRFHASYFIVSLENVTRDAIAKLLTQPCLDAFNDAKVSHRDLSFDVFVSRRAMRTTQANRESRASEGKWERIERDELPDELK